MKYLNLIILIVATGCATQTKWDFGKQLTFNTKDGSQAVRVATKWGSITVQPLQWGNGIVEGLREE